MLPKGKTRKQLKDKQDRQAEKVIKAVRGIVSPRDGHCRISLASERMSDPEPYLTAIGACHPFRSEWSHLTPYTRAQTRGKAPEERHSSVWTLMACQHHHDMIDGRRRPRLEVSFMTDRGADGPLAFTLSGVMYSERV